MVAKTTPYHKLIRVFSGPTEILKVQRVRICHGTAWYSVELFLMEYMFVKLYLCWSALPYLNRLYHRYQTLLN